MKGRCGSSFRIAVLVSTAKPVLVVVARSQDVAVAANQIVASLTATFGGRGGGKPDLAQAGGLDGELDAILAAGRSLVLLPAVWPRSSPSS